MEARESTFGGGALRRLVMNVLLVSLAVGLACGLSLVASPEARSAPYQQVVDNTTPNRFDGPGWKRSDYSPDFVGKDYRYTKPSRQGEPAAYRVDIPDTATYTVYARWPANGGYNPRARVGVQTTSGYKVEEVNQTRNGGRWVRIGAYEMRRGDDYSVRIGSESSASGFIIADAVKVVKGDVREGGGGSDGGGGGGPTGEDVVREAKTWLGVPYRWGGSSRQGVDCSGLTMQVYDSIGITLPRTAAQQYGEGRRVSGAGQGDLVFGNFNGGSSVEHVGIAVSGNTMINAPYPGTVVRRDPIYDKYTLGIKRLVPNN